MTIEIVGKYPPRPRIITGLWSLDQAFINDEGELGFPVGHGNEFYGLSFIGKSTFTLGLAGILAKTKNENISFVDLEGFDRNHLIRILDAVGFSGKVYIPEGTTKVPIKDEKDFDEDFEEEIAPKKPKKEEKQFDELQLSEMITNLRKDSCCVGILDSIGAVSPIAETEGDIGEAFMGRRGSVMAQFTRKCLKLFKFSKTPKTIMMLNHWYPKLGSRGYNTPGGEVKKYLASVRVHLSQIEKFPDDSYILEGFVDKNRWGKPYKTFHVFMLSGKGIHLGLSWMYDGITAGVVKRGKGGIKIGDKSVGYLKDIVRKAHEGDDEYFLPFKETLESMGKTDIQVENEETTIENDENKMEDNG